MVSTTFVASSAVFPRKEFAPTLSIVALASRIADTVRDRPDLWVTRSAYKCLATVER
jgi:hypothetical protein